MLRISQQGKLPGLWCGEHRGQFGSHTVKHDAGDVGF
jgi:hypothetical protein